MRAVLGTFRENPPIVNTFVFPKLPKPTRTNATMETTKYNNAGLHKDLSLVTIETIMKYL